MASLGEFDVAERDTDPDAEPDTFLFCGVEFQVAATFGALPLLRFSSVAERGVTAESMEGMAAIYDLIRYSVGEDDWPRFQSLATEKKAGVRDLMNVCNAIYFGVTGRPTSPPVDSASGPSPIGENSREPSSSDESLSPIQQDPRVMQLVPVEQAAKDVQAQMASAS